MSTLDGRPAQAVEAKKKHVQVVITCGAAGDYTANTVMSSTPTADAGRATKVTIPFGAAGEIVALDTVAAKCDEDSVLNRVRIHIFNAAPLATEVEMDDRAAVDFAKIAGGLTKYLDSVDLPAFRDMGGAMAFASVSNLGKLLATLAPVQAVDAAPTTPGDNALYVLLETLDAETNETASMKIYLDLYFL